MRHDKLDTAVIAAQAFIKAANEAYDNDMQAERYDHSTRIYVPRGRSETFDSPSKQVASVKRKSLDLTRALSDLRKRENQ